MGSKKEEGRVKKSAAASKHATIVKKSNTPAPKRVKAERAETKTETSNVQRSTFNATTAPAEQHVPGQVEVPAAQSRPVTPAVAIPAEGNNIASVHDRAHADTPPANDQPPVEKTFVSS